MSPGEEEKKKNLNAAAGEFLFFFFFFFLEGHPSFIKVYAWVSLSVRGSSEAVMPSSSELVSRDQEKVQWHGPKKMGGRRRWRWGQPGIQFVSAHRPFLSRQTGTLKHSHTCICLRLAWGARTPTKLSWQLYKCLKWDTRQFLWQHIIANNLPCKVIINALFNM